MMSSRKGLTQVDCSRLLEELSDNDSENSLENCYAHKQSFDPSNQITLSWHDIKVFVKPQKRGIFSCNNSDVDEQKQLLYGVSGVAKPGELVAIMGASGAGKTTLLNVLTNRNLRLLDVQGDVLVNGQNMGKSIVRLSAFVQQNDLFIGTLKVREHLIFQAMVRMDNSLSYKEKMKRVDEVILELGLSNCTDTSIGIAGRIKGISGGEAKRLAFAAEVLTNPSLMFCDEPTSGLDSFMAYNVVSVLRDLAKGGRTIICTIHQPSSEVFELFDHLLLLAEGRIAYRGEASKALSFFESAGFKCPLNYNPADFYIRTLAIIPGKETESKDRVASICSKFEKECNTINRQASTLPSFADTVIRSTSRYKASWCSQFRALIWRGWLGVTREPMLTKSNLLQAVIMGILLGLVYFNQSIDQNGVQNINGIIFLVLINISLQNVYSVINTFTMEQTIFLREHWNGMYRTDVYFLSKTLAETPVLVLSSTILATILYWMVGLNPDIISYLFFVAIIVLVAMTGASFGYMVSCASSSHGVALNITTPLTVPLMLFGGFYLNAASVPIYFIWAKYISWFYYGNEAAMINQWSSIGNITCTTDGCPSKGSDVLQMLNFNQDDFYLDLGLIGVLLIFYRTLAFLALFIKSCQKT